MSTALARVGFIDAARQIFPKATADEAERLLWNHTAYPFVGVNECRQQLLENKLAWENGSATCDHCPSPVPRGLYMCDHCRWAIEACEESDEW